MANQLSATVVNSDGSTYVKSFSVEEIWAVQGGNIAGVNSVIYENGSSFLVAETISQLATLAGSSMILATQLSPVGQTVPSLFSSVSSIIGAITNKTGIASYVLFKGKTFYCVESSVGLTSAANASSGGGGGSSYLVKTYAELVALINANGLVVGTLYKISDRGDRGLFFTAISTNQLAKDGTRLMLCPARYSPSETDGSGNVWKGVWDINKTVSINDLVIWGGKVWKNLTADIGTATTNILLDVVNWELIPKTSFSNNEYIELLFGCTFDVANDWIERQWDGAGNEFGIDYASEIFETIGFNLCDVSDWNFSARNDGEVMFNNRTIGVYNNSCRSIHDNTCGWTINNNSNNGEINNNTNSQGIDNNSNFSYIRNNSNNGYISGNSNAGIISHNSNNGNILNNTSGAIFNNINNGNISGTSGGDISDTIVNKP